MRKAPTWNIEAAETLLLKCALLVDRYGDCMIPALERAEAEYNKLRQPSATDRVKAMLAEHRQEDGRE